MEVPQETINEYVRLVVEDGRIRGRHAVSTLVAIGCAESRLDNKIAGNNHKNGTKPQTYIRVGGELLINPVTGGPIDLYDSKGLGWLQHDSGWMLADEIVNGLEWNIEAICADPAFSIDLLFQRPGFIRYQGEHRTYINFDLWATYPKETDKWIEYAEAGYDLLIAEAIAAVENGG